MMPVTRVKADVTLWTSASHIVILPVMSELRALPVSRFWYRWYNPAV
jgi:hypothetical protein